MACDDELSGTSAPIWLRENAPIPIRASHRGRDDVDVLVVGAGLAGVATAYYLAGRRPDLRIAVAEAGQVGLGATGRSTGMIGPGLSTPLRTLRRRYPDEIVARAFDATLRGTAAAAAVIDAESIDCDLRIEAHVVGAGTAAQERRMRRHAHDLAALGHHLTWWDPSAVLDRLDRGYRAAFAYEGVLLVDPYALVTGLAAAAERSGVSIFERTRVQKLDSIGSRVLAQTAGGSLSAAHVLIAVDGYGEDLNPHQDAVLPIRTHVLATAPLTPDQQAELGWDGYGGIIDQRNFFSYHRLGAGNRLIFGGGPPTLPSGDPCRDARDSAAVLARVSAELRTRFPALADVAVEASWSGLTGGTLDRLPLVGRVPGNPRVHYAGGWCGHGLALCMDTAQTYSRELADLVPSSSQRIEPGSQGIYRLPWFRDSAPGLPSAVRAVGLPVYLRSLAARDRRWRPQTRPPGALADATPPPVHAKEPPHDHRTQRACPATRTDRPRR